LSCIDKKLKKDKKTYQQSNSISWEQITYLEPEESDQKRMQRYEKGVLNLGLVYGIVEKDVLGDS
jgi:hypothetical protein